MGMLEIVTRLEQQEKDRFHEELGRLCCLIEQYTDQEQNNPSWSELEEHFLEAKDAFVTWQAFEASLGIYRVDG